MFLKLLIISIILVAIVMLALGVKLIFDPNAVFEAHSCSLEEDQGDHSIACTGCQLKNLAHCPENN